MKKHYIKAVVQLLLQGKDVDVVLANLARTLKQRGHERLHAHILSGVHTELLQRRKTLASVVIVAKSEDALRQKDAIGKALHQLGGSSANAVITVDKTLIGGFVAAFGGKSINRSYKEKLVALYRLITA